MTEPTGGTAATSGRGRRRGRGARPSFHKLVISPEGRRGERAVAGLRLASAAAMLAALIPLGGVLGDHLAGEPIAGWRWGIVGAALLVSAVFAGWEIARGGAEARAEEKRIRAAALKTVFAAESLPKNDADEFDSGRLIQLMTDNTERVTEYRQVFYGQTLATVLIPFGTLAVVTAALDWIVGLVTLLLVPLIPVLVHVFMRYFRKTSAASRSARARLAGRYLDAIRNLVPIRMLGAGERVEAQLREAGETNRGTIMKLLAGNQVVIVIVDGLFSLVLICASTALAVARMNAGAIDVGTALAILFCTILMLEPLGQIAGFFYIGMGGMASEKAIGRYLSTHRGGESRQAAAPAEGHREDDAAIRLEAVRYDYGRGEVLHGISLAVPRGGKVAIVGRSGAGKSTLLSLLRGSLPLQDGRIVVDGHDLAGLSPARIRDLTATVSQTTWLFTGTIADNLRVARPDATDEELWEALRRAHLADDVQRMAHGLDTDAGERGGLLSGGQAQRIALARALLSGRRILLLDEPTSQVDIESEARIIDAIADIAADHTVLAATHRRALLDVMDAVYEMRAGVLTPTLEGAPA